MKNIMKNIIKNKSGSGPYGPSFLMLALSALLICAGLLQGQQMDVLTKAVKICLECVGIG